MGKENLNNNVDNDDLTTMLNAIDTMEKSFIIEAKKYLSIGETHTFDFFCNAIVNRGIALCNGFKILALSNNYIAAVPMIRLQIDNCLRFYAGTLVQDFKPFFWAYLKGEKISNMTDIDGKKMSDSYLAKKLDEDVFPGIHNLYVNASGYVHLSNEHTFLHTKIVPEQVGVIGTKIGHYDFFSTPKKVDFAYNMLKTSEFLLSLVTSWTSKKEDHSNNE